MLPSFVHIYATVWRQRILVTSTRFLFYFLFLRLIDPAWLLSICPRHHLSLVLLSLYFLQISYESRVNSARWILTRFVTLLRKQNRSFKACCLWLLSATWLDPAFQFSTGIVYNFIKQALISSSKDPIFYLIQSPWCSSRCSTKHRCVDIGICNILSKGIYDS